MKPFYYFCDDVREEFDTKNNRQQRTLDLMNYQIIGYTESIH